jgi:hypothetical protein
MSTAQDCERSCCVLGLDSEKSNAYIRSYPSFVTIRPHLTILQQEGFIRKSDVSNLDGDVFELTGIGQKALVAAGIHLA